MKVKRVMEYFHWIVGTIDKSGIVVNRVTLRVRSKSKTEGVIRAPAVRGTHPGLILRDGSTLSFKEDFRLADDGEVVIISYVYHYERPDGYFFRYEKLAEPHSDPIFEPTLHLHVIHDAPRFPTHCTNLAQVLDIVRVNFFR